MSRGFWTRVRLPPVPPKKTPYGRFFFGGIGEDENPPPRKIQCTLRRYPTATNIIDIIQNAVPIHWRRLSFSLKRKNETIAVRAITPPFIKGKRITPTMTPVRYRFSLFIATNVQEYAAAGIRNADDLNDEMSLGL